TQHGFYVSQDEGNRWQPLRTNLPDTQVSDIWVDANDLAIATHGGGFYVLDNVNPLRQYAAAATSTDAYLFKPADAIRLGGGASIAYWVKKQPQSLKLEILDDKGQVVRTFEGAAPGAGRGARGGEAAGAGRAGQTGRAGGENTERTDRATPTGEDEEGGGGRGRGGPQTAAMATGLQRFNWDLQY